MKNIILKNGIIGGLIIVLFMGASVYYHSKNLENPTISYALGFSGMLIAFAFIVVGIKQYRDTVNNGVVTFGKAFTIGLLIALLISTIYVVVWFFEMQNFYPDFMEKYAATEIKNLQSSGLNPTELQEKIDEVNQMKQDYKNPIMVVLYTYMEIFPFGILIALISALILKRNNSN